MAARLIYGSHGVDPYSSVWPAYVNDDAAAVYTARAEAKRLKEMADKLRLSQRELSATEPLVEALYEADVLLSNAASAVDNELDQRGFVVS